MRDLSRSGVDWEASFVIAPSLSATDAVGTWTTDGMEGNR